MSQNPPSRTDILQKKAWIYDEQTGELIELHPEQPGDTWAAVGSVLYLLLCMGFFFWLMFDIWIERYTLIVYFGYATTALATPAFQLFAYAFIGGALGGIVNGLRSIQVWHSERGAFGSRFVWKYVIAPWMGAALALFTFALIQSGVAVFSGEFTVDAVNSTQVLATFAIGVLAGYGSREAFIWLDSQVKRVFQVTAETETVVHTPDLTGATLEEALVILENTRLKLGKVEEEVVADQPASINRVIRQMPAAREIAPITRSVNITLGAAPPPEEERA